jgi:hypothetical protein
MSEIVAEERYNGWKNYPTWAVNLWLSNTEGLYRATQDLVVAYSKTGTAVQDVKRVQVADALKDWVTKELSPNLGATFAADLLCYAFGEVDWYEIATAWLEELDQ